MASKELPKPQKAESSRVAAAPEAPMRIAEPRIGPSNQAMIRLFRMVREDSTARAPGPAVTPLQQPRVQAKLTINQPGDIYEQEADRIADEVMRMPDAAPAAVSRSTSAATVQRKCAACEEEENLHRSETGPGPAVAPPIVHDVLSSPGKPLPAETRTFFEPRFDHEFDRVRIHTDRAAAESAAAVQSVAFTAGKNIVFGSGQFAPGTHQGKKLLAHELSHVVQQNGSNGTPSRLQRQTPPTVQKDAPAPAGTPGPPKRLFPTTGETATFAGIELSENPDQLREEMLQLVAKGLPGRPVPPGIDAPGTFLNMIMISGAPRICGDPGSPDYEDCHRREILKTKIAPVLARVVDVLYKEHKKFLADFQQVMKDNALQTLSDSKERTEAERTKYGITATQETRKRFFGLFTDTVTQHSMADPESPVVKKMREAAKLLLSRRYVLRSKAQELSKHMACSAGGCGKDPEYDRIAAEQQALRKDYRKLQQQISFEFPILDRMSSIEEEESLTEHAVGALTELEHVANGKSNIEITAALEQQIEKTLEENEKARKGVESDKVNLWQLDLVYKLSKAQTGVDSDPFRKKIVEENWQHEQPHVIDAVLQAIALIVLNVGAIALAAPTGGASLAIAFGVDAALAAKHTSDYLQEKALAGSDLQRAQSLSQDDPSFVWLAIEIIGVGLEGASAVAAIRAMRPAVQAAQAAQAASKEAKLSAEAIESINNAAKPFEKPQLAENVIGKLPKGNAAVLEQIAPASEREIGQFARATQAIEAEAVDTIGPSVRSTINTELKISRAGHIFTCSSPCQMIREKYAKLLTSGVRLEGETDTALQQLVKFEERAVEAAQKAKLAKTPEEIAKAEQSAKALEKEIGEFESKLASKSTPAPVSATIEDIRAPKPNTIYESNGYYYKTDGEGRLSDVTGELKLNKAERNPYQQGKVGKSSGVSGDEGGHMIGAQFDGPGEGPLHMVPQGMKLNRGAGSPWRAMEEQWAAALRRGDKVSVKIHIDWPPGTARPNSFDVESVIVDGVTGAKSTLINTFLNP
jgi:hypothetical protein